MLAGLHWTSWLLLMAPPLAGLAIILPFYLRNRRSGEAGIGRRGSPRKGTKSLAKISRKKDFA